MADAVAHPAPSDAATVRVARRVDEADGVVSLELVAPDGRRLPDWDPGAHVDLVLPTGAVRQYSLCGDRFDAHRYRIGVLREPDGRGGSAWVHESLREGDVVGLGGPRNNFPLVPAPRYRFVAGGIGITPLLPMIRTAELLGADWELLYGGRTRASMAFLDELDDGRVHVAPQDVDGLLDIGAFVGPPRDDTRVYGCGPAPMLAALAEATSAWAWAEHTVRTERFVAAEAGAPVRDSAFDVELARRGVSVTVTPDRTVLDAVRAAGVEVLSSCRQGVCGTCETSVLSGEPDHRDSILDDAERAAGDCMFVCVSRSCSDRLVLDL